LPSIRENFSALRTINSDIFSIVKKHIETLQTNGFLYVNGYSSMIALMITSPVVAGSFQAGIV